MEINTENIYLVKTLENNEENQEEIEFLSFQIDDNLLAFEHPNKELYYAQSFKGFGLIKRKFVIIIEKILFSEICSLEEDHELKSNYCTIKAFEEHEQIGNLQGWLEKRGFWLNKDWKRRWFVLNSNDARLYYYVSELDVNKKNHQGFIDLKDVTTVHESFVPDSRKKQNRCPFEIHTPQRVWFLSANRTQEMEMWIFQLNQFAVIWDLEKSSKPNIYKQHRAKVLQHDISLNLQTKTPGIQCKPQMTIELEIDSSEIETIRKNNSFKSEKDNLLDKNEKNNQKQQKIYNFDDFSQFGAPDGEEILNKCSILSNIDHFLGYHNPPDVEYIYVEPYLNYASKNIYLTANPYGHSVVRYTLPDTKEQLVMNIVGLAEHELVNFLHPEDFFFSTNFDTKIGNEQGGIYNRNFVSMRIQRVPPEKILAMHQYFLDLHLRSHKKWADYNILLGPLLNRASSVSYGNCAHWSSQGLRQAGLMKHTSMFPKAIWIDLYESLLKDSQQEKISNNISIVYYKRILHAKRFYGEDADWTGWGRPTIFRSSKDQYDNLEQVADAIVYVPSNSKTAMIDYGPLSNRAKLENKIQKCKLNGKFLSEVRFDYHVDPRILFNEFFYRRFNCETLERTPVNNELRKFPEHPFTIISCGYPLFSNCWKVSHDNQLYKTFSKTQSISDLIWIPIEPPNIIQNNHQENPLKYSILAPGEDGSCWIVYGDLLFYRTVDSDQWISLEKPTDDLIIHLCTINLNEGVWVLTSKNNLFKWSIDIKIWEYFPNTPKLRYLSSGKNEELWGLTIDNCVYRRIKTIQKDINSQDDMNFEKHKSKKTKLSSSLSSSSDYGIRISKNITTSSLLYNYDGRWIQLHGVLLKSIAVASPEEVWGIDRDGRVYVWSQDTQELGSSDDIDVDTKIEDSTQRMSWQSLGNILPITTLCVNSQKVAWGISDYDPGFLYKLSRHRLLVLSTKSSRKIWDDRNTPSKPYKIGYGLIIILCFFCFCFIFNCFLKRFWRPIPPKNFYSLGDIAERSHLENSSLESLVVCEVGRQDDEDKILVPPVSFEVAWRFTGSNVHYCKLKRFIILF